MKQSIVQSSIEAPIRKRRKLSTNEESIIDGRGLLGFEEEEEEQKEQKLTKSPKEKLEKEEIRECDVLTKVSTSCSHVSSSSVVPSTLSSQERPLKTTRIPNDPILDLNEVQKKVSQRMSLEKIAMDFKSGVPSLFGEKSRQMRVLQQTIKKQLDEKEEMLDQLGSNRNGQELQQNQGDVREDTVNPKESLPKHKYTIVIRNGKEIQVRDNASERISSNSFCTPSRKTQQGAKWTEKESAKFLKALEVFGTDFSLIQALFPTRSPLQIKNKFMREEKQNSKKVEQSLINNSKGRFQRVLQRLDGRKNDFFEIDHLLAADDNATNKQEAEKRKKRLESFESIDSDDIEIAEEVRQYFPQMSQKNQEELDNTVY